MEHIRYRQVHLDFHTSEYIPGVGEKFSAEEFADTLEKARVDSITCFARCHHGWLYYPSKRHSHLIHPNLTNNRLLIEQIDACHRRGIRVPIYTTAQWDGRIMREHPEWLAVGEDGGPVDTQGVPAPHFYYTICLNSGYRQFFKEHLTDIVESVGRERIDGIFIDILFQVDCCCPACKSKMEESGLDHTDKSVRLAYANRMLDEFKEEMTDHIHTMVPEATVFYNSSHIGPAYKNSFKDYSHLELESLPSGGWGYDHFPATSRYARGLGKEIIGMTGKFHTYWGDFHSLKNRAALEFECFQMLAMGAGCSVGDQLHPSGKLSKGAYDLIGHVYRSVEEKEPYCKGAKALTEIAVFNPEEFYPASSNDHSISPSLIGTVRMLTELAYQFDIVDTDADLSHYKLVILPDCIYGNEKLDKKIREYVGQGGKVLYSYRSLDAAQPAEEPDMFGIARKKESPYYREFVMPNQAIGKRLAQEEFVMYVRGLDVEMDSSCGGTVLMDKIKPYFDRGGDKFCSHQHAPSSGEKGSPEAIGSKQFVYFSHPVFAAYRKNAAIWCKEMVKDAIDLLLPQRLIEHSGPSTLVCTVNSQKEENRLVLHLLHYITEKRSEDLFTIEDSIPLSDLEISVCAKLPDGGEISRIYDPLTKEEFSFSETMEGRIAFKADKVAGHRILVFE